MDRSDLVRLVARRVIYGLLVAIPVAILVAGGRITIAADPPRSPIVRPDARPLGAAIPYLTMSSVAQAEIQRGGPPRLRLRTASIVFGSGQTAHDARPLTRAVRANCARHEVAVGGGTVWSGPLATPDPEDEAVGTVYMSYVQTGSSPTGVLARGANDEAHSLRFTVQALCLAYG